MIIITFISFLVICFLYEYYQKKRKAGSIPGPGHIPFFGSAFEFLSSEDPLNTILRLRSKYGDVTRVWLCSDLYIILTNPEDVEVLLNSSKHTQKATSYRFLLPWLGNGLILSHGERWQVHRKLLTPTFHFKILENSIAIIYRNAKILSEQLENEKENEFNIHKYIEKCSLDIICEAAMGIQMDVQKSDKGNTYLQAVKNVTKITVSRCFKVWLQPQFLFKLSGYSNLFEKSLKIMEDICKNVIISKREELISKTNSPSIKPESTKKPFLDFLLTESKFSDEEIHAEVKSFMFAGHDTTTSALGFCIHVLATYPDIQEKVYNEVMSILPNDIICPSVQELNNLKYMEKVIKETMRVYPTVPMIGRTLTEEAKLPSGYTLPANTHVNIFIYSIHQNPKIFEEPEKFRPERFDDEKIRSNPYSYIPFSAGPRNCIGQRLAMFEIKMVLSSIIRKFLILPSREKSFTLTTELILRTEEGINVILKKRSQY